MGAYIPPLSRMKLRGFKDCHVLNVREWESSFTLQKNVAKNTDYIKKYFK